MTLTHPDNIRSSASSLSGSSFSLLTSPLSSDDPFEAIDESSSDEDEVVWTANEFDPDEDFILIPQSLPKPQPNTSIPFAEDASPPDEAFSVLSLYDPTSTTPIANAPTPTPHKSKHKPNKPSGYKGRRSAGAPSEVSGRSLASTAPKPHKGRRKRGKKDASTSYPSPSPSPERDSTDIVPPEHDASVKKDFRFGERPLVEESDLESDLIFSKYEDAVCFITSFLSSPSAALTCSTCTRLTFLQSLIIELGLMSPSSSLPSSLKSAKHLLKTRAFINIGEYLSARGQGVEKLQQIMFNSRRELTSDLRKKKGGKKADKGWVKRHGLNVLLVTVF